MDVISALHNRVSIAVLGGPGPDQAQLDVMLRAAMRAPDHGVLRPWRFLILEGQQRQWLGDVFVEARLQDEPDTDEDALAKLRITGILLDEKAYDEALKMLDGEFLPQYASAVADRRGDILVAQNKLEDARKAYIAALAAMGKSDPGRSLVQAKLESIGGTAPAKPADAAAPAAA